MRAGYRDDDDGILEGLEAAAESERKAELVAAWEGEQARRREVDPEGVAAEERDLASLDASDAAGSSFVAHVVVPDQATIKQAVLARRKEELLAKLASSGAADEPAPRPAPQTTTLQQLGRLPPSW